MQEPQPLEEALREAQERLASLEAEASAQQRASEELRRLQALLIKRRQLAQHRGVVMWEGAQRAALRMVLLAVGCGALIAGASTLEGHASGVAIALSFAVLAAEGLR